MAGEAAAGLVGTDPAAAADGAAAVLLFRQVQVRLCLDLLFHPSCSAEACPCQVDQVGLGRVHRDRPSSCWARLLFLLALLVDPWAVLVLVLAARVGSCWAGASLCLPGLGLPYRRPVLPSSADLLVLVHPSSRLYPVLVRLVHGRASSAAVRLSQVPCRLGREEDRLGRPSSAGLCLLVRADTVAGDHCSSYSRAS